MESFKNKKNVEKLNKDVVSVILLVFMTIISVIPYLYFDNIINEDEYESLIYPFYVCGVQWLKGNGFHGFLHTIIITPFLRIFGKIGEIYFFFLIECLIFRIVIALIVYWFGKKMGCSEKQSLLIAIVCVVGIIGPCEGPKLSALAEVPLCLISLGMVICFTKLQINNFSGKIKSLLCLSLFIVAAVCLHSRAIVYLITSFVIVGIYMIKNKEWYLMCYAFCLPMYKLANTFQQYITDSVSYTYVENRPNTIGNFLAAGLFGLMQEFVKEAYDIITHLIGLVDTYILLSFGTFPIVICAIIQYLLKNIKNKNDILWYVSLFGILNWFIMSVAAAKVGAAPVNNGDYRWYTYVRYAMPFTVVVVMSGLIILVRNKEIIGKLITGALIIDLLACKSFLNIVVKKYISVDFPMEKTAFYGIFEEGNIQQTFITYMFIMCSLIFMIYIIYNKWKCSYISLIVVYLIVSTIFAQKQYDFFKKNDIERTDLYYESYEFIKNIELDGIKKVYISGDFWYEFYLEQRVALVQFSEFKGIEEDKLADSILITNQLEQNMNEGVYYINLNDSNQYVVTQSVEIYNYINGLLEE